ncbi:LuxR C-terminal-related transcriptional regulator [Streptomyces sp. NPDC059255]|uniref:LuxR C-terminal-related transcriptional regulator n=1 Tax=Streptomyces sp. NPDC059255 TaxID=3346793 RepID=UPI0036A78E24
MTPDMAISVDEHMYELYGWILDQDSFDPRDAAKGLGLTPDQAIASFERLILLGLVRVDPRNSLRARAVDPDAAALGHTLPLRDTIRCEQEKLDRVTAEFNRLRDRFLRPRSGEEKYATVVPNLDEVRAALTRAAAECREEMLTIQPGGNRAPEVLEEARQRDHALLSRGVPMRTIYHHTARFNGPSLDYMSDAVALGAEYRTAHELTARLIIFDHCKLAFIPMRDNEDGAVIIHEPSIVAYLRDGFEEVWTRATPCGTPSNDLEQIAKELNQTVIQLLGAGLKDESIARRLGMSLRTTRRHIADIMKQLGAESRFQAGVLAARLYGNPG